MNNKTVLEVKKLSFDYPDMNQALKEISFSVEKGTKVFFHGKNGAGKTTLFQCLSGLFRIKTGKININDVTCLSERERMKRISIVFQNANDQLIAGTVFEEVAFGLFNLGLSDVEVVERTRHTLSKLNIGELEDRPPHFLSYGQKKKVTIASILALDPDIILFDEPTAGLDPVQTEEFIHLLDQLVAGGKTLLVSTHDTDFSFRCADQVVIMAQGQVVGFGEPRDIFSDSALLKEGGLIKPLILEIIERIDPYYDYKKNNYPKNREELFSFLEKLLPNQDQNEGVY